MNKPKQLTFPWSKPNKSSFNEYYFDDANKELQKKLLEHEKWDSQQRAAFV